jgi:hypothetical protein
MECHAMLDVVRPVEAGSEVELAGAKQLLMIVVGTLSSVRR